MLEVIAAAAYMASFLAILDIAVRHDAIKNEQARRRKERKKELERRELDRHCDMVYKIYQLEKKKANRQTVTVKGVFAGELAEILSE